MSTGSSASSGLPGAHKSAKTVVRYKEKLKDAIKNCGLPSGYEKEIYENVSKVVLVMIDPVLVENAISESFPDNAQTREGRTMAEVASRIDPVSLATLYGWTQRLKGEIKELTGFTKWVE